MSRNTMGSAAAATVPVITEIIPMRPAFRIAPLPQLQAHDRGGRAPRQCRSSLCRPPGRLPSIADLPDAILKRADGQPSKSLRAGKIAQIGRRLILAGRHQGAVAPDDVIAAVQEHVMIVLG